MSNKNILSPWQDIFAAGLISCHYDKIFPLAAEIFCHGGKWFSRIGVAKFTILDFSHACFEGFGFQKRIMLVCRG